MVKNLYRKHFPNYEVKILGEHFGSFIIHSMKVAKHSQVQLIKKIVIVKFVAA